MQISEFLLGICRARQLVVHVLSRRAKIRLSRPVACMVESSALLLIIEFTHQLLSIYPYLVLYQDFFPLFQGPSTFQRGGGVFFFFSKLPLPRPPLLACIFSWRTEKALSSGGGQVVCGAAGGRGLAGSNQRRNWPQAR